MVSRDSRRIDAAVSWDNIALATPALFFVESAAMAAMKAGVGFVQKLDAGEPLGIFFAVKPGHNHSQRKTMTLRQWLAVHLVCDQRAGLHSFLEAKRLVVSVRGAEEYRRHLRLRLRQCAHGRKRHAFPNRIRTQPAANAIGNAEERGFLLDCRHRRNLS